MKSSAISSPVSSPALLLRDMIAAEAHYKVPWRNAGNYPGRHLSRQQGGGLHFHHHVALVDAPDPRRFDLRASLRDPFGRILVRTYLQTSAIPLYVVADLSASMSFDGRHAKTEVLADLVACLAYSAYRTGDSFGFIGCGEQPLDALYQPATLNRAAGQELAGRLRAWRPAGKSADGLLRAAERLGTRRALIFLVSDFHAPLEFIARVLSALSYHDVIPVVLWDRHEHERLPRYGLARVVDPESGASRLLLMRPNLRRRIADCFGKRRAQLEELFARHGRMPMVLEDGFEVDAITRYFYG